MRLPIIIKSNLQVLLGTLVAMGIIACLELLPKIVGLFFDQPWPKTVSLNSSLVISSLSIICIITTAMMVSNKYDLFTQFNVSRNAQFYGNILTILVASFALFLLVYVIYPVFLSFIFEEVSPLKDRVFVTNGIGNWCLNELNRLIEIISAGLGGYFIATFIKRFSVKWFVVFAGCVIVGLPIALALTLAWLPQPLVEQLTSLGNQFSQQPGYFFALAFLELFVTVGLIKLMTINLSHK